MWTGDIVLKNRYEELFSQSIVHAGYQVIQVNAE